MGNEHAGTRILVVGNSITRHGPKKDIGWEYDWGMAASAPEKDYVHRLFSMLKKDGQNVFMRVRQCSFWETHFADEDVLSNYDDDRAFNADIVIYRLGENVAERDEPFFKKNAEKFIRHISGNGKVIMTTCFWKNEIVDEGIRSIAKENGYSTVFTHPGRDWYYNRMNVYDYFGFDELSFYESYDTEDLTQYHR